VVLSGGERRSWEVKFFGVSSEIHLNKTIFS